MAGEDFEDPLLPGVLVLVEVLLLAHSLLGPLQPMETLSLIGMLALTEVLLPAHPFVEEPLRAGTLEVLRVEWVVEVLATPLLLPNPNTCVPLLAFQVPS